MEKPKNAEKYEYKIEYLQRCKKANDKIKAIRETIQMTKIKKQYPAAKLGERTGKSGSGDLSDYTVLMEEREEKHKEARYERIKIISETMRKIKEIEKEEEREVLIYRYIMFYEFWEIAKIMNKTYRNIMKIHKKALENMQI